MRLLIAGVNGQLGSEIYKISNHENYGIDLSSGQSDNNIFRLDLTARQDVIDALKKIKPDWTVHCAALRNPDDCETNKEAAWQTNVIGTKNIVDACNKTGSKLIFISTSYVFDGIKGFYKENDTINPINFYGKTKVIGEWLAQTVQHSVIVRTCALFSDKPNSMFNWIITTLEKGDITGAVDLIESPTSVSELAKAIIKIIEKDLVGIYHMAGDERISRFDLMKKIALIYDYDQNKVKPIRSEELEFKSLRPKDTSLDISKAKRMGMEFSSIDDAFKKLRRQTKFN